jgi:RimJ/RimL family protein N-acetyltransferase
MRQTSATGWGAHWGCGIASAAPRAFLDIVTERPPYGRTASTNPASRRVLEYAGFRLVRVDDGVSATVGRPVDEAILRLGA